MVTDEKFRLVMGAKAKSHGFSLNDLLLKISDFVPPLIAILIRTQMKKVAFVAEIREIVHLVLIRNKHKDSQRFLWRRKNESHESVECVRNAGDDIRRSVVTVDGTVQQELHHKKAG